MEVLDPEGGDEKGKNRPLLDWREKPSPKKLEDGMLHKVNNSYAIFCQNWESTLLLEETYMFAGFSILQMVQGSDRYFVLDRGLLNYL